MTSRDGRAGRAATDRPLPEFTEHAGNVKTRPLDDGPRAPAEVVRSFVRSAVGHAEPRPLRVLDVGCGRGDTVAWLLDRGVEAYGIDVRADYLANGREYLDQGGHDGDRLRLLEDGRYPFEDATFDVVLSDQVLEHVADLAGFVGEVARVSRPGSAGLHVFPARWRPVEVHMRTPLVHWLPKGRARRAGLRAALAVGAAAPYFRELDGADRCEVFARYSETETFYRPLTEIRSEFERAGLDADAAGPARERVHAHAPWLPRVLVPPAAAVHRTMFSVCLRTYARHS